MTDAPPTEPPLAEPPVERPRRSWRGWLKEYAVIVIGVLTALAAQQAAEWWKWQSEVKSARAALAAEAAGTNAYFAFRIAIAPCMERQSREAEAIIADLVSKKPPRRFTVFRAGAGNLILLDEWQSQRASQTLTHFPRKELALMNRYHAQVADLIGWRGEQGAAGRELSILLDPPPGLDLATLMRLKISLATFQTMERLIVLNAKRQLELSKRIGFLTPPADLMRVKAFCNPRVEGYKSPEAYSVGLIDSGGNPQTPGHHVMSAFGA